MKVSKTGGARRILVLAASFFTGLSVVHSASSVEFPDFAEGHWFVKRSGSSSYVIRLSLTDAAQEYSIDVSRMPKCDYLLSNDDGGRFRYEATTDGCNSGIFTLERDGERLNVNWSNGKRSGTHVLNADAERNRADLKADGGATAIASLTQILGRWNGVAPGAGFGGGLKIELAATTGGAQLVYDQLTLHCEYAIAPEAGEDGTFAAFVYSDRNNNCKNGNVSVTMIGDELEFIWQNGQKPFTLVKTSGPSNAETGKTYPDVKLRGVGLGDAIASLRDISQAVGGSSPRPMYSTFQGANSGYLDADVAEVYWPVQATGTIAPEGAHEDVLAAFAPRDVPDASIYALLRDYHPMPESAPTAQAMLDAITDSLGEPNTRSGDIGRRLQATWFFEPQGDQAKEGSACLVRRNNDRDADAKVVMFYSWFDVSIGRGVHAEKRRAEATLQPIVGCGFSLTYVLTASDNGALKSLVGTLFDHSAVAADIWQSQEPGIVAKIERGLELQRAQSTNAPKL